MRHWSSTLCATLIVRALVIATIASPAACSAQFPASLSGKLVEESGGVPPTATIKLISPQFGLVKETSSDREGRFSFNQLVPGRYDLVIEMAGFKPVVEKNVKVDIGQQNSISITVPLDMSAPAGGPTESPSQPPTQPAPTPSPIPVPQPGPPPVPGPVTPVPQKNALKPTWNVWTEEYATKPAFRPLLTLKPDTEYSLFVDLSAIDYLSVPGVYAQQISDSFDEWLQKSTQKATDLDVLVIPDDLYFDPQVEGERVKRIEIDLERMRRIRKKQVNLSSPVFEELATDPDAEFKFGRLSVRIKTKSMTGLGSIALSFWVNRKVPIDELTIPICVAAESSPQRCPEVQSLNPFNGSPSISVEKNTNKKWPNAALHFVELNSGTVVGVFRCNDCKWKPNYFRTWTLGRSAAELTSYLNDTVLPGFENAKSEEAFVQSGSDLFNLLFSDRSDADAAKVSKDFVKFVEAHIQKGKEVRKPPSVFVRLLGNSPNPYFLIPLRLLVIPLTTGEKEFLGEHFIINTPLKLQDYTTPKACISQWVMLLPPEDAPKELRDARQEFSKWLEVWDDKQYIEDMPKFRAWIENENEPRGNAVALMTLSHHDTAQLFFNSTQKVASVNVRRKFAVPSLAIINACGTAKPGAAEFVQELNSRGVTSVIATSTAVQPAMAGAFINLLAEVLEKNPKWTLYRAEFEAVQRLRKTKSGDAGNAEFGPRAFIYTVLGNGDLRICAPAKRSSPPN